MYKGKHPRKKQPWWKHQIRSPKKPKPDRNYVATETLRIRMNLRYFRANGHLDEQQFNNDLTKSRSFSGVQLPNYKSRIKNVLSATTPMTSVNFAFSCKPFKITSKYIGPAILNPSQSTVAKNCSLGGVTRLFNGSASTPPPYSGATYTLARNRAIEKLYDTIRSLEHQSGVGEDLGDISQTYRMLTKPAAGILDLTHYLVRNQTALLKKAKWNNIKQTAKALGNLVTEYVYGIDPLTTDLAEARIALENRKTIFHFAQFRAKGVAIAPIDSASQDFDQGVLGVRQLQNDYLRYKLTYKGVYSLESQPDQLSISQSLGLTWREAIPTLYNLIPYSFLLDYVANLDQIIASVSIPWSNVRWCNLTEKSSQISRADTWQGFSSSGDYAVSPLTPGYSQLEVSGTRRTDATIGIPVPTLMVNRPSAKQLRNTLALVAGHLPVIGSLTKRILRSPSGKSLDNEFKLVVRDRSLKVPYPFHR